MSFNEPCRTACAELCVSGWWGDHEGCKLCEAAESVLFRVITQGSAPRMVCELAWRPVVQESMCLECRLVFGLGDRERRARGAALLGDLLRDVKACFRLLAHGTDLEHLDWDDPARYDAALGAQAVCRVRLHAR